MTVVATAVAERVVRIVGAPTISEVPDWECVCTDRVGYPPEIVAQRRAADFDELVFANALTPRAGYEARHRNHNTAATFRGYESSALQQGRLDLWRHIPSFNRCQDINGDLHRFVACLQDAVDLLTMRVGDFDAEFDSRTCTGKALKNMLLDQGNPFAFSLPGSAGRRLSSVLIDIYRQKGTARGIINAIRLFLGLEVSEIRCHIITRDEGVIIVGGAAAGSVYAFDVVFAHQLDDAQRERVKSIVGYLKPAHTHLVGILPQL